MIVVGSGEDLGTEGEVGIEGVGEGVGGVGRARARGDERARGEPRIRIARDGRAADDAAAPQAMAEDGGQAKPATLSWFYQALGCSGHFELVECLHIGHLMVC